MGEAGTVKGQVVATSGLAKPPVTARCSLVWQQRHQPLKQQQQAAALEMGNKKQAGRHRDHP